MTNNQIIATIDIMALVQLAVAFICLGYALEWITWVMFLSIYPLRWIVALILKRLQ